MNAVVEASRHIATLFPADGGLGDDERIELRPFRGKRPGPRSFHRHSASAVSEALRLSATGYDVFVGVAPRRCPDAADFAKCLHKARGGKTHIARIDWAFVEIDTAKGEYETVAQILERLDNLPLPPHLVIASGGGAHAYWRFHAPLFDVQRLERITRGLSKTLGHDPAFDISRVLRVAGTANQKYHDKPRAAVVR